MRLLVTLLLSVTAIVIALWSNGARDLAYWVGTLGTCAALGIVTIYVVGFDSRTRWPNRTWLMRLGRLFTFER